MLEHSENRVQCPQVGASVLSRVLARLQQQGSGAAEVLVGLGEADDAAVVKAPPPGHVLVHTVDFFRSFVSDPFVFGKVAAVHALGVRSSRHVTERSPHSGKYVRGCQVPLSESAPPCLLQHAINLVAFTATVHPSVTEPGLSCIAESIDDGMCYLCYNNKQK